jgi:hypothetical protein
MSVVSGFKNRKLFSVKSPMTLRNSTPVSTKSLPSLLKRRPPVPQLPMTLPLTRKRKKIRKRKKRRARKVRKRIRVTPPSKLDLTNWLGNLTCFMTIITNNGLIATKLKILLRSMTKIWHANRSCPMSRSN